MSTSTLSITANPAAVYRRRQVVLTDHNTTTTNLDQRTTSKEALQPENTVSPRRTRKGGGHQKPRWLTVVSVLVKNFVLLIVLLGLVQLVRKMVSGGGYKNGEDGSHLGLADFEERVAAIDLTMKKTVKLMQVQMEVIDKKVDAVERKIVDKVAIFEGELRKLVGRAEGLERSVGGLKGEDWFSKRDFEKVYEELKNGVKGGGGGVGLDDVRVYARELVVREIEKHAADGLGRVDYALAAGGGMVVRHSEPYLAWKGANWFLMAARGGVHPDAVKMLKPSFGEPGQCFPLKGSSGFVEIRLRTAIIPEAITLEHVSKSVAYDRSSAPNVCRVSGWQHGHSDSGMPVATLFLLAEFAYDLEKSNAQTFDVNEPSSVGLIDTVRLDFVSNHGSPSHTCIYRLRVHGHEPDVSPVTVYV